MIPLTVAPMAPETQFDAGTPAANAAAGAIIGIPVNDTTPDPPRAHPEAPIAVVVHPNACIIVVVPP